MFKKDMQKCIKKPPTTKDFCIEKIIVVHNVQYIYINTRVYIHVYSYTDNIAINSSYAMVSYTSITQQQNY